MSIIDLVILFILVFFTYHGLKKGLIRSLGNLVALIFGAYFASHFYLKFFEWGSVWVKDHEALGKVLVFIILFIAATQLVNFVFFLIEKIFNLIAFIPGSKYINNLLGGVLALLEGSLFLGLIIFVASRYAVIDTMFGNHLTNSFFAPHLLKVVNLILPVLPEALKALKAII